VKQNVSEAPVLVKALSEIPSGFKGFDSTPGSPALFTKNDIEAIMKATAEEKWKDELKVTVEEALARGAFGAPWLWVTNEKGVSEPFFGSDR
jgi:glutathione S-transferase kappa 1